MARRDLTALAALGTLGYLLSKKGDKEKDKEVTKTNVYDVEDARKVEAAPEEDPMEVANRRVERTLVNPNAKEFGEPGTSETVTPTKKPVIKPTVKPMDPKALARSRALAGERAMGSDSYTPSRVRFAAYDPNGYGMGQMSRKSEYLEDEKMGGVRGGYKKGGKVKKMASGGMTSKPSSASKRADGIASRGKTKCKMY